MPRFLLIAAFVVPLLVTDAGAALDEPILYVHGFCGDGTAIGSDSTWGAMTGNLGDLGMGLTGSELEEVYFDGNQVRDRYTDSTVLLDVPAYAVWFIDPRRTGADRFNAFYVDDMPIINKAYELRQVIGAIRARKGGGIGVRVIAHSMGGLVTRALLENMASHYAFESDPAGYVNGSISTLITVDTPHQGSDLASLWFPSYWCLSESSTNKTELQTGSSVLTSLNTRLMPPSVPVTSIISLAPLADWDGVVTRSSQDLTSVESGLFIRSLTNRGVCDGLALHTCTLNTRFTAESVADSVNLVAVGSSKTGTLTALSERSIGFPDAYASRFLLVVNVSQTITISMTSPNFDSYLQLFDGDESATLGHSSHGGVGAPAVLGPIFLNQGLYEIEATTWLNGPTGAFTLSVAAPAVCPSIPTSVNVSNITTTGATVDWSTSGQPSGTTYDVQRSGGSSAVFTNVQSPFADSGLATGQSYCYQVRAAVTGCSTTNWSAASCISTSADPCAGLSTPSGLTVTAASNSSLSVAWSTAGEPSGTLYDLERDGQLISGVSTPYIDGGFTAGSSHTYRVRAAKSSCGSTGWSNYVSGSTSGGGVLGDSCSNPFILPAGPYPVTVQGTTVGFTNTINQVVSNCGGSGTSSCGPDVFFQFTPTTTETYVVNVVGNNWSGSRWIAYAMTGCTNACADRASYIEGPGSDYSPLYATANTTYTIVIDGAGAFNCSSGPYELSIGKCSSLHTPSNLQASATSPTSVVLTWDATGQPPGTTTTIRRTNPDGSYTYLAGAGYYNDTSVQGGTTYTYAVGAGSGACGASALSSNVVVTTPADPCQGLQTPSNLSAGSATNSSLTVSWSTAGEPAGTTYDLQRTGGGQTIVLADVVSPFVDSGLVSGMSYSYNVRAMRPGCSASPTAFSTAISAGTTCSPVSISVEPDSIVSACSGSSVTLGVHAGGSEPFTFQWQKDGVNIGGATTAVYQIQSASSSDAGTYQCIVTNNCGSTSTSPAVLAVPPLPSATITAPAIVCADGSSKTASVPDAGAGAIYVWSIVNGTIANGPGTRSIAFSPGSSGSVVISISVQSSSGCSVTSSITIPISCTRGRADFNGDNRSDVIWRKSTTGEDAMWLMNGVAVQSPALLPQVSDINWKMAGVGDFDNDGRADVLWWHAVTGQVVIWMMNGTSRSSAGTVTTVPDTNWKIAGVGDFDGDGKSDVVWRNAATGQVVVWLMNGLTIKDAGVVTTVSDLNWTIAGIGDFDGDGKSDLLWRHGATGQDVVWLMNGKTIGSAALTNTVSNLNYKVIGVGDADGDTKADVFWWNQATGDVVLWKMNGAVVNSGALITTVADTNWRVEGVGDFDGDGKADLIWRKVTTGDTVVWLMNGLTLKQAAYATTVSDLNWSIVAPR